jgi:hypothetical protein
MTLFRRGGVHHDSWFAHLAAMVIADVVREILNGKDFLKNVELLKSRRREAILYVLSILDGTTPYELEKGVHPFDAHDAAHDVVGSLGFDDFDFLIQLLETALQSEKSEPAFSIAWVLAYSGNSKAIDPLMKAMTHKSESVRWAACTGLQRFRAKRARPLLNTAAAARSSFIRGCAVDALKSIGDASSLPVLKKRLNDRYPGIRDAAAKAIEAIQRRESGPKRRRSSS